MIFTYFFIMITNVSSLFNKIPTFLVDNKDKIPTSWVENKNFSQNFVIAFEKMSFSLDLRSGLGKKIPGSGSVKNEYGSATLFKI